jgi:glycosyltransferase involved in cell wall biosynthesis
MATEQPLVSVVIPAYNVGPYIAQAIDSVLAQTYTHTEIIVVAGKSTDNTLLALEPYINKKLIAYIEQPGRGLSNARNLGIRAAHGEFIALLDADDIFLPHKLEQQVGYLMTHPDCDVCYCDIWHFRNDAPEKLLKLNYIYYSGSAVFPNLLKKNFIAPLTVALRRSAIDHVGLFDETYLRSEDWEYWVRLAYHGAGFYFLPEILAKSRIHPGSMSSGWHVKAEEKQTALRIFESLNTEMSPQERRRYHMGIVLFRHRLKLWSIYVGNYFPPLQWLHRWIQQNRLK